MYRAAFPSQWLLTQMMTHGNAPPPPPPYSVTFYNSGSDICPVVGVEPMVSNSSALLSTPSALEIANADYAFKKSSLWNRKGYFSSTKSVSSSSKTFHSNGHGGRYRTSFQNPDCELVVQKRIDRDRRFDRPVVKNSTPNVHHSFNKGLALVTPLCSSSSVYDMSSKGIKRQLEASSSSAGSSRSPSPTGERQTSHLVNKKKYQGTQDFPTKSDNEGVKSSNGGNSTILPASIPRDLIKNNEWDKLSSDIWAKFMLNRQSEDTYNRKMRLRDVLYHIVKERFPGCGLYVVGSSMNGFGCDSSDIDMCLMLQHNDVRIPAFYIDQKFDAINILKLIQTMFNQCDFVRKVELIRAKVPILKFVDTVSGVEVDLNVNNSVGIRNTHLLHNYSKLDWRVCPLVLVVKLWARAFDINDAKNMSISSYSLTLMVIHYLQYGVAPAVLPCLQKLFPLKFLSDSNIGVLVLDECLNIEPSTNKQTLGELFSGFLHYYAHSFQYKEEAVSVRLGRRVPKHICQYQRSRKNNPGQWKYLCIEEPFDLTNTARSVYDASVFDRVKLVFKNSYEKLQQSKMLNCLLNS